VRKEFLQFFHVVSKCAQAFPVPASAPVHKYDLLPDRKGYVFSGYVSECLVEKLERQTGFKPGTLSAPVCAAVYFQKAPVLIEIVRNMFLECPRFSVEKVPGIPNIRSDLRSFREFGGQ
jgi:hypothetical protein